MPKEGQPSVATLVVWQTDFTAMHALGEVEQRAGGRATSAENERALRGESALGRDLIVRNDGRRGESERPVDLGPAMMESAVMAVDDEGDSIWSNPNLAVQEAEAGPGVPETDHVSPSHEHDLVCDLEGSAMRSRFPTQEVGTDVQNHKMEAVTKLAD